VKTSAGDAGQQRCIQTVRMAADPGFGATSLIGLLQGPPFLALVKTHAVRAHAPRTPRRSPEPTHCKSHSRESRPHEFWSEFEEDQIVALIALRRARRLCL
jgi:hypothetical protein